MPSYKKFFPSKYLTADDLGDRVIPVTMIGIKQEPMPGDDSEIRPVIYFEGAGEKGLVLNRTNAKRIAKMYGEDTDAWIGQTILLYPSETEFRGDTVACIRVKADPATATSPGSAFNGNAPANNGALPPQPPEPVAPPEPAGELANPFARS